MILVTGANGQLGTELRHLLDERNEEYVAVDVAEMDITDADKVDEVFAEVKPTLVYHCAAYTAVDAAEDEGKELDYAINVTGTENVAKAAEKHGATLVYISTDYVFDGEKPVGQEWEVDDKPDPQTEYGRTKRMGEELVEKHVSNYYIIRTAWVFGNYGKNFVFTMQNLAKTHKTLTVVNDQHGRPTWTRTLAEFMTYLAESVLPHFCGFFCALSAALAAVWVGFWALRPGPCVFHILPCFYERQVLRDAFFKKHSPQGAQDSYCKGEIYFFLIFLIIFSKDCIFCCASGTLDVIKIS